MWSSLRRPYSCTGRTFKESPGAISPLRENPRLTQAGRNLWRPPSPLPSPLTHDHHVQVAFEHLQGQRLCHVSLLAQRTDKKGNVMKLEREFVLFVPASRVGRRGDRGIGCDMTLLWSSYQVQIRLILNKSLLGSCIFLFAVFSLQPKICFGSILAAFRKALKWQFTSGSSKTMVCMIISSASWFDHRKLWF